MSDQPTPPSAASENPDESGQKKKKPKQPRSEVRQEYLDELTLASEVAAAAGKPDYAAVLEEESAIDAEAVTALLAKIEEARLLANATGGKATEKKTATSDEDQLKKALVVQIGKLQSLAKAAYERGTPGRGDYYIGKKIDSNRPQLEQHSLNLITRAKADTKLKAPAALLAKLEAARTAYVDAQQTQTSKTTAAATTRKSLATMVKEVADLRRNIQYAADAAWPAVEKVHRPIRKEFKLPLDRALV